MITAFLLALLISLLAYLVKSLSWSGVLAATVVGTLVFGFGGLPATLLLMTFFVSSSVLSKLFGKNKARFQEKFSKGSRRDYAQVLANGGVSFLFMLFHGLFPGQIWPWIGFTASLAAVNADTWATELGVLARRPPRMITTGEQVVPGTSGAVSLAGTLAALAGAGIVALTALLLWPAAVHASVQVVPFLSIISLSGLVGALIDSLLGATVQVIYHCPACDKETERYPLHLCGTPTAYQRGWPWLNNDWVNTACALSAPALALLAWFIHPF